MRRHDWAIAPFVAQVSKPAVSRTSSRPGLNLSLSLRSRNPRYSRCGDLRDRGPLIECCRGNVVPVKSRNETMAGLGNGFAHLLARDWADVGDVPADIGEGFHCCQDPNDQKTEMNEHG